MPVERISKSKKEEYLESPPDGGWGWWIVIGGIYNLAMWGGISRCYSVFFSPLMLEFDAEFGSVSWLSGLYQVSYGLSTSVCPFVMKKMDRRLMSMTAASVCAVSCFLASFCHKLWQVQALMGLMVGICMGFISLSSFTATIRYFSKRSHMANQALCFGISLGPLLVCPGYQYIVTYYGWRGACQIVAGFFLNMMVACALMRPIKLLSDKKPLEQEQKGEETRWSSSSTVRKQHMPEGRNLSIEADIVGSQSLGLYTPTLARRKFDSNFNDIKSTDENDGIATEKDLKDDMSSGLLYDDEEELKNCDSGFYDLLCKFCRDNDMQLLVNPIFYIYSFSWIGFSVAYFSSFTYMIPYGKKEMKLTEMQASMLVSAFAGGEIFSRTMYALLFDRMPQRFRILYISVLFAVFAVIIFLFPFIRGRLEVMICCASLGILGGGSDGIFSAFIAEIFSVRLYPSVFGFSNILTHSIGMASTVLIGSAVDRFDNLAIPFYIGSATASLSSIVCFTMHRTTTKRRIHEQSAGGDSDIVEKMQTV